MLTPYYLDYAYIPTMKTKAVEMFIICPNIRGEIGFLLARDFSLKLQLTWNNLYSFENWKNFTISYKVPTPIKSCSLRTS